MQVAINAVSKSCSYVQPGSPSKSGSNGFQISIVMFSLFLKTIISIILVFSKLIYGSLRAGPELT